MVGVKTVGDSLLMRVFLDMNVNKKESETFGVNTKYSKFPFFIE